jgi:hypothetical protein
VSLPDDLEAALARMTQRLVWRSVAPEIADELIRAECKAAGYTVREIRHTPGDWGDRVQVFVEPQAGHIDDVRAYMRQSSYDDAHVPDDVIAEGLEHARRARDAGRRVSLIPGAVDYVRSREPLRGWGPRSPTDT